MAFEILNEAASVVYVLAGDNRYPQAEPDKVDFDILAQGVDGEGVVSGAAVTPQGVPDTTVAVAAAVVRIAGTDVAYVGGNVDCGAAAAAFPRFDLIAIDNAGAASAVNGVAAAVPVFPAVPANSVIVAAVWRAANDDTITAADIVDKRCLLLGDALGTAPTLLGIVGGIATPNRSHHTLSAQAGAADDLDGMTFATIIANGEIVIIRPDAGDTITVKHNALGAADDRNILCIGNADIVLDDDHDFAICIYATAIGAGSWMALGGGAAAAGGHVIENEGAPLAARANLNFTGGLVDAADNAPDTDVHIGKQPDRTDLFITANANPHLTIGGAAKGIRLNDHVGIQSNPSVAPDTSLRISPVTGGVIDWRGIELAPVLTVAGNNRSATGIFGSANVIAPAASTGHNISGLSFTATALLTVAGAATFATVAGCRATAGVFSAGAGRTLNVTDFAALEAVFALTIVAGAVCNITAAYGLHVLARTFAAVTVTTAYGIRVGDLTNVSGNCYLLEIGPATPYLRLLGDGNPAANQTNLYLKEQATLRQVQWMDPGAGGVNFVGGERVMILV